MIDIGLPLQFGKGACLALVRHEQLPVVAQCHRKQRQEHERQRAGQCRDSWPAAGPFCESLPRSQGASDRGLSRQEITEIRGQLMGRCIAFAGELAQALQANRLQVLRNVATHAARGTRFFVNNAMQYCGVGCPLKWRAARQQSVQKGAESINIGSRIEILDASLSLLR